MILALLTRPLDLLRVEHIAAAGGKPEVIEQEFILGGQRNLAREAQCISSTIARKTPARAEGEAE